jgi:hypothetical protein
MSESTTLKPAQKGLLERMVLNRPRYINLNMLRQALLEEDIFLFMGLMNPFLEATMSQGGISTETFKANDKDELITEIRQAIARKLEGMPASVVFEDDDLSISNEEEDFMSKADRLYEQANDK